MILKMKKNKEKKKIQKKDFFFFIIIKLTIMNYLLRDKFKRIAFKFINKNLIL